VGAIRHVIADASLRGPVNVTAPSPVTNGEFAKALGRVLRRPTVVPVPVPALKAVFGSEMVREMFLSGQRVVPERLLQSGYQFHHTDLEGALRDLLERTG
jgi:NAD dependent epimerase/dehydratase family enzyme